MKSVKVAVILMLAVAVLAGSAFAAPTRIGSLEKNISVPVRVALDSRGNIYVTDGGTDHVEIFDAQGAHRRSLDVKYPLGIAVAADGTIYVGSGTESTVKIFTPDLAAAGCLGGKSCENILNPNDIAIDASGKIYVVDSNPERNVVNVYDAAGVLDKTIKGSGASLLRKPMGVAINDTTGEVFVADKPFVSRYVGDRPRIQVFDKAGTFLRQIGTAGYNAGQFYSAIDLALDAAGTVYLTDSTLNVAHIMDPLTGVITGELFDLTKPGFNQNGIAAGKNGLVYEVVQRDDDNTGRVDIYALDGYITMATSPSSLLFESRQYAGSPAAQAVTIANGGSGTLNWAATADQPWIQLSSTAGTTGSNASSSITVSVDTSAMTPGSLNGAVTITSDYGQENIIDVTVNVRNPLILNISSGLLAFTGKKDAPVAPQSVLIGVDNLTGPANWTAASDSTWLSITPASATVTADAPRTAASVSVNTAGMAAGTYTGVITLSAPGVIGDGSAITVSLTVKPSTKIAVNTNLDAAKFTIAGPVTYSGAGRSWSVEDVTPGVYGIEYAAVRGYQKPAAQSLALGDSGEISFTGTYVFDDVPPALSLSTLADGAYTNNATLNIAGTATDNGAMESVTVNNGTVVLNADGAFSQAIALADGPNIVTIVATDEAGNQTTDVRTIVLDQTAPVVTIVLPADNSVTNETTLALAGAVDKIATVSVRVNDEAPVAATMTGNSFNLPLGLIYCGQNTIQVTATDRAGNIGTAKRTVIFDNENPTLAVTDPAQDITTHQPALTIQGSVADLTGTTITVSLDGFTYEPDVVNGLFSQQVVFSEEKTHAVIVTATDEATNTTTIQRNIIYARTPSVLTYTGASFVAQGSAVTLSARLTADGTTPAGQAVSFSLGSQSCSGTTDASGNASCTIDSVTASLGPVNVTTKYDGNSTYKPSTDGRSVVVFAYPAKGAFVISDASAIVNRTVTFWGAQWSAANSPSGGAAPVAFKGFEESTGGGQPSCGGSWSAGGGNSATPPATVPAYMAVIVSSSVAKSGSTVTGNIPAIVIVVTNPGYGPDPSQTGTGTVVGVLCSNVSGSAGL